MFFRRVSTAQPVGLPVIVLALAASASATLFAPDRRGDLDFFLGAYRAMVGEHGLGVYAEMPNIQSGPLALLALGLLDLMGSWGFPIAVALAYIATIVAMWQLPGARDRSLLTWLIGGGALLLWWRTFAFHGHLDDAMAVALAVAATVAATRDRRLVAGVLLGISLAVKPWTVFMLPVAMGTTGPWHRRLAGPLVGLSIGAALWAPFILADRGTLSGMRPTVRTAPDSVLHLLTDGAWTIPAAVRVMQLAIAFWIVHRMVARGRVEWALVAGVAVRLLLDGGTWPYYTAGLVAGALLFDLTAHRHRLPWAVLVATLLLPKPTWIGPDELRVSLRLVACTMAIGTVLWLTRRSERRDVRGASLVGVGVRVGPRPWPWLILPSVGRGAARAETGHPAPLAQTTEPVA